MNSNSNSNQDRSTIMNKNMNSSQPGQKLKKSKKKSRKFYQRTKFFGNSLYQTLSNKDMNDTQTFSMLQGSIFKKSDYQSSVRSMADPTMYLNDYLHVSNEIFKEKFLALLMDQYERQCCIELFDNKEVLTFTRELTQYMNKLSYLNLQYDQWTYYYELGTTEAVWHGRVSKKMAMVNSMCVSYGRGKALIRQRQKYFQNKIINCKNQLEEYKKKSPLSIDLKELERMINHFIEQDQYRLRIEFEQQRHTLKFDGQDHRLVQTFYELNARKTEISSAKTIWKATHYEQLLRYELTIFKKWMSLPTASMTMHTLMELDLPKMNELFTLLLTNKVLSNTMSTTIVNEILLKQLVLESMNEAVIIIEKNIQTYIEIATVEKTKILKQKDKFKKLPTVENVIDAIESRQQNMVQSSEYHVEQTMKIIFRDK